MKLDLYITIHNGFRDSPEVVGHRIYRRKSFDWSAIPDGNTPIQVGRAQDEPDGEWRVDCFSVYRRSLYFSTNSNVVLECDEWCDPEEFDHLCECLVNDGFELFLDRVETRI